LDLLCMTSPNALLPEINATTAIPALSMRIRPSVPPTQYLKKRISKARREAKKMACERGALAMAAVQEFTSAEAKKS
jgi:hypothetical protein